MKKRIVSLSLAVIILFCGCVGRIAYISLSSNYTASDGYNSYSLVVDSDFPTLYWRDMQKINNDKISYAAVIKPTAKCLSELDLLFDFSDKNAICDELKSGYPVIRTVANNPKLSYIRMLYTTSDSTPDFQLISQKSSGLKKYIASQKSTLKINFNIDAKGRLLSGDSGTVESLNYNDGRGYVLSLDKNIQSTVEAACKDMKSGCAIVMDVSDGCILACVTKPDSSCLNKPFMQYSVGSVFKIVVAACALENGIDPSFECKGSIIVGDTVFSCAQKTKHSTQHLREGLANSCNCYFVNLAQKLGREKLTATARSLGFYDSTTMFEGWEVENAKMPSDKDLLSKGELSLLGFGQGKLLCTPLQMCSVLCTVSNNGNINTPHFVNFSVSSSGLKNEYYQSSSKKALKKSTAKKLLRYLRYVVTDGTGYGAETSAHLSAGKTATAQTGQFNSDGSEKLNTWFAGVYPSDNPKYAITVMNEDGISGSKDCCPIYRTIVENL